MNYNIKETTQFSKDLKELIRNGFDIADLKQTVQILIETGTLPDEFKTHTLERDFSFIYDSHLDVDMILLWRKSHNTITLVRIGTHSDLF